MTEQRVALVTGANRGLGLEAARQLGQQGVRILLGARDVRKGEQAAAALLGEGISVDALTLDMSSPESISAATQQIIADPGRLDILVNNAVLLLDLNQQPADVSDAVLRDTFEVNFFGPYQLLCELAPLLKDSGGRVLNMATQVATLTQLSDPHSPLKEDICPAYQSSKIALNALFAKELAASGAKVNSACPGWVLTDMGHEDLPDYGDAAHPLTPPEAVAAYLWLTGPEKDLPTGGFFTGHERVAW